MQIGSLEIQLLADLARLKKDMDDVKGLVGGAMSTIERSVGLAKTALLGLGGTLTGIGSITAFKGMISDVIEAKVQLQHLSIQTGASVESLSAIGAVSKLTGTNIGDVGSAINKMQKNLATSTEDSRGAATALKALGISFDEFVRLKADQQMLAVAKAMNEFQDGAGKAATAMLLYGKTGAQLLPMLKDLADKNTLVGKTTTESALQAEEYEKNLKRLAQYSDAWKRQMVDNMLPPLVEITKAMVEARKEAGFFASIKAGIDAFGDTVLGWGDAARRKPIKDLRDDIAALKAESAGVTVDLFGQKARWDKLIVDKSAKLAELLKEYYKISDGGAGAGRGGAPFVPDKPILAGDFGAKEKSGSLKTDPSDYDKFNKQTLELIGTLNAELDVTRKLTQSEKERAKFLVDIDLGKLTEKEKTFFKIRYTDGIVAMQDEVAMREHLRHAQELDLAEQKKAFDGLLAYSGQLDQSLSDLAFQTSLLGKSAEAQSRMTAMRRLDIEAQKALLAVTGDPTLRAQVQAQNEEAQARTLAGMDAQIAKQKELNGSWQFGAKTALDEYLKQVEDVAGQTKQLMTNSFKGMEDALVSFATTGKLDFKSLANSIIANMVRMQVQASITGPLSKSMKTGLDSGGGLFSGLVSGIKDLFGGGSVLAPVMPMLGMPGYANGGDPPVGRPYMVGERGPELRIDRTPGTIVPAGAFGGNSTNLTTTVNISIDSRTDRAAVYADVSRAMADNNKRFSDQLRQQGVLA